MRSLVLLVAIAVSPAYADAPPSAALGKPLPSPDLPVGTVSVRVIAGDFDEPVVGAKVELLGDGAPRSVKSDAAGRARFDGLHVGTSVHARVGKITSDTFVVPDSEGTRVMLTTAPLRLPSPPIDTEPTPDASIPDGELDVQLTYHDLTDPKPPANVVVTLIAYRDDRVTVTTRATNSSGHATFAGLDRTGSTAYYAQALLPRGGGVDRVASSPIVVPATGGIKVVLTAQHRNSSAPPVDNVSDLDKQEQVPAATVRVRVSGVNDGQTDVVVHDASTGAALSHGAVTTTDDHVDLATGAARAIYVTGVRAGRTYRSLPLVTLPHAGSVASLYVLPPIIAKYAATVHVAAGLILVDASYELTAESWSPQVANRALPLPRGTSHVELEPGSSATLTSAGLQFARPLVPGTTSAMVHFELAAPTNSVRWQQALPYGSFKSQITVDDLPGVTVPGAVRTPDGLVLGDITILPNQELAFDLTLPAITGPAATTSRACLRLRPDRTPLVDKPMPPAALQQPDGLPFGLPRGKPMLVNFDASWNGLLPKELPTLDVAARAHGKLAVIVVFSDANPADVKPLIAGLGSIHAALDAPPGNDAIGRVTTAWGMTALPESYLIDARGIVRYHITNLRDWTSPDAAACLTAFAQE